jgi:hypothetical protein
MSNELKLLKDSMSAENKSLEEWTSGIGSRQVPWLRLFQVLFDGLSWLVTSIVDYFWQ